MSLELRGLRNAFRVFQNLHQISVFLLPKLGCPETYSVDLDRFELREVSWSAKIKGTDHHCLRTLFPLFHFLILLSLQKRM